MGTILERDDCVCPKCGGKKFQSVKGIHESGWKCLSCKVDWTWDAIHHKET